MGELLDLLEEESKSTAHVSQSRQHRPISDNLDVHMQVEIDNNSEDSESMIGYMVPNMVNPNLPHMLLPRPQIRYLDSSNAAMYG